MTPKPVDRKLRTAGPQNIRIRQSAWRVAFIHCMIGPLPLSIKRKKNRHPQMAALTLLP
jgi:hypothetical protein